MAQEPEDVKGRGVQGTWEGKEHEETPSPGERKQGPKPQNRLQVVLQPVSKSLLVTIYRTNVL